MKKQTLFVFLCVCLCSAVAKASQSKPQSGPLNLIGTWEVIAVRMDEQAGAFKIPNKPNDARFIGIELAIEPHRVSYDITEVCENPSWRKRSSIVKKEVIYGRGPSPSWPKGKLAPLKDMGFQELRPNDLVMTYSLTCESNRDFDIGQIASFFTSAKNESLYASSGDVYLVFKRRMPGSKPKPSFSCDGELSAARQTICNSAALSLRESAAANVWINESTACRPGPSCPPSQRAAEQKAAEAKYRDWFKETVESCGGNVTCLIEKIREGASLAYAEQWHDGNRDLR
jgi:hypothetical protein